MVRDISKTILFDFSNLFTKQHIFTIEMPYQPFLATNGYYSGLYKSMKEAAANNFEKGLVVGKVHYTPQKHKRTIFYFSNGIKLDMPYDVTPKDISIIKHQIQVIKMSLE